MIVAWLPTWPSWVHAAASALWAAASALSLWVTLRHPEMRRTGWLPVNTGMMLASAWWTVLNSARAFGTLTTADYQQLIGPLVPPVLVLWAGCRMVFWRRAARTIRVDRGLAQMAAQSRADRQRYGE